MKYARTLVFAVTFGIGVGLSAPALAGGVDPGAATPVQREQAQARFLRGKQLFESRSYEPALVEFRASFGIVASPNTRLYVARSLRELGRIVEAYVEFGRTNVEAREQASEDARYSKAGEAAAAERDALKQRLGFVTVRIDHPEESTRLLVGDEEIRRGGWSEPIPVSPGAAQIRLETPGRTPVIGALTIDAGQTKALTLDAASGPTARHAAAAAAATPANVDAATPAREEPTSPSLRPFAYVAGGVGVAGIAAFAIFGLMAKGTHDDLVARCPGGRCTSDVSSDVTSGQSQQTLANVALVVGAVGLAAGVVLFVLEPKRAGSGNVSATVGLGRFELKGRF